jgi:hypothetical protein
MRLKGIPHSAIPTMQMPLVPSVVLPVGDSMSWDVPPQQHDVVVYLQKDDSKNDEEFNAAAVIAFVRTHMFESVKILPGCSFHKEMLRSGTWLEELRKGVAKTQNRWAMEHVCFA